MNACESECLRQDDMRLFHKGACHIFATVLRQELAGESYILKRVVLFKEFDKKEAYHVFAAKDDFLVDASGIKRANDFVAWLTAQHVEKSFGSTVVPVVELHETSEEELLTHHHDDPQFGGVNCWSLFSGKEFINVSRARAKSLIRHWPEEYQVSVLQAGFALTKK